MVYNRKQLFWFYFVIITCQFPVVMISFIWLQMKGQRKPSPRPQGLCWHLQPPTGSFLRPSCRASVWPDPLRPLFLWDCGRRDDSSVGLRGCHARGGWSQTYLGLCSAPPRGTPDGDTFLSCVGPFGGREEVKVSALLASGLSGRSAGNSEEVNKHVLITGINSHLPP